MSIFGFGEISFSGDNKKGPLNALVSNEFKQTTLRYPLDIGNHDKAHYMVIYIRQQKNTNLGTGLVDENVFNQAADNAQGKAMSQIKGAISSLQAGKLPTSLGGDLVNKVNSGLNSINNLTGGALSGITGAIGSGVSSVVGGIGNLFGQTSIPMVGNSAETQKYIDTSISKITDKQFYRTTKLTSDAIALYMPDTLNFEYAQEFEGIPIGGEALGQAAGVAKNAIASGADFKDSVKKAAASGGKTVGLMGESKLFDAAGAGLEKLGLGGKNTVTVAKARLMGAVQNPMLEMIYKTPQFRNFSFEFKFYPRDEKEALEVQRIIERLRFHQAPEFYSEDVQGFLIPPSEFDIKFYQNGSQNPNIPPMTTAVLKTMSVNYAPEGFHAYEVPGESSPALGRTGMPVAIQVTLQFQETSYLTKEDFANDGGVSTQAKV